MANECKALHETIIRDIIEIINDAKDLDVDDVLDASKRNGMSRTSLAKKTSNMIMVFPLMVSSSTSINAAVMLMKAHERKCATMVQLLFSAFNVENFTDMEDLLNKFHRNIKLKDKMSIDDAIGIMDMLSEGQRIEPAYSDLRALREDMGNIFFYFDEDVNPTSLNQYQVSRNAIGGYFVEGGGRPRPGDPDYDQMRQDDFEDKMDLAAYNADRQDARAQAERNAKLADRAMQMRQSAQQHTDKMEIENRKLAAQARRDAETKRQFDDNMDLKRNELEGRKAQARRDAHDRRLDNHNRIMKQMSDSHEHMLVASDVKKANELVPTIIKVNFLSSTQTGEPIFIDGGLIGVKCRLIPVESNDIITHIVSKTADTNWLFNLIRATTRETSFVKDFLFGISTAKIDALANSKRGSSNPMWKVLERRALGSRWKRLMGSSNAYMAITSLALTQEDVDYMKKEFNIDFMDPDIVDNLFSKYNLMAAMVVDESLEVAKFMYDTGEGNWESLSFTSLERDDKDNTYKKVVNLMTKVAR